ncbi:MAG: Gfo/Idh/MocA family oxidoreductase [Dehalococcoidia bacterium]|nr:MAG: Gfo/Idh/MocA family oxidoreductase [Dehalococcoidia bacterium]
MRYGVIGTGLMGLEHIRNLALVPGAQLVAAADPNERSRGWAAKAAGPDVALFVDYRTMLREASVDAAIIATPNFTHAAVLDDVLPSGLHILCEKPLCTTYDDCRRVVDAVEGRGGVFWTGMEYRYSPPVTRFVREVHDGAAGAVKMLAIREHRFPFLQKVGDWNRFNRNTGGTLVEKSCHHFDLMRHVLRSEPVRVFASGGMDVNHLDESYNGEMPDILDNALVVIDFANGARAMLDLCMFAEGSRYQSELAATGDAGKVECLTPGGLVITGKRAPRSVEAIEVGVDEAIEKAGYHHGATYYELLAFQRAIINGGASEVTAMDGLRAVAMGLAAQRSIDEARPVLMREFGL